MNKKIRNVLIIIFVSLIIAAAPMMLFNKFFAGRAIEIANEYKVRGSMINGIKHSYTSAYLYTEFRNLGMYDTDAEEMVLFLGEVNEFVERIFKPKRDSTLEMIKDMQNNLIGIRSIQWHERNKKDAQHATAVIGIMAERDIILASANSVRMDNDEKAKAKLSSDPFEAVKYFNETQDSISDDVNMRLNFYEIKYN